MKTMSELEFHSGIKMRLYPSTKQKDIIAINIGTARFVYNRMVALNKEKYQLQKTAPFCPSDKYRLDYVTTVLSSLEQFQNTIPFLEDDRIDAQTIANARRNYSMAWNNYRKNPAAGPPTFHHKGYDGSYQTNAHYYKDGGCNVHFCQYKNTKDIDRCHMTLPKLGRCRIQGSPDIMEKLIRNLTHVRFGTITISVDSIGRYFVSIQVASDIPFANAFPQTGSMRGYDMNLENFYTDSDGNVVDNPRIKRSKQKKLSKRQRTASRRMERNKRRGRNLRKCKNYQVARKKAALINMKIATARNDLQHVISRREVESQDFLFVEDLKTKNLMKNHKLSYAIGDASWSSFHHKLEYKAVLYGKTFHKVDARNTTQTCSECNYVLPKEKKLTLSDREWTCPNCGVVHDCDHNSAKVILFRGMADLGI